MSGSSWRSAARREKRWCRKVKGCRKSRHHTSFTMSINVRATDACALVTSLTSPKYALKSPTTIISLLHNPRELGPTKGCRILGPTKDSIILFFCPTNHSMYSLVQLRILYIPWSKQEIYIVPAKDSMYSLVQPRNLYTVYIGPTNEYIGTYRFLGPTDGVRENRMMLNRC